MSRTIPMRDIVFLKCEKRGENMKKKTTGAVIGALLCGIGLIGAKTMVNPSIAKAESGYVSAVETSKDGLNIRAKSAYLMDFGTQTPIYTQNEKARLPIASMCKIMTLLLCFEEIDNGNLTFEEEISISDRAASMGGSQVFLEANAKYSVKELIKSIVVCSANDSCVAMAERIAGSEELFVEKMNAKAKQLGANDTLFSNCTGLPKEPQYSCAKDVATMLKALLLHEEYYEFGKVWMDKFQHPEGRYTEISNTNKLVRFYDGCDGGKTGFTNEAGFCLAATAKRDGMRVISVVIGEENSTNRFEDVKTMFNYAFANYKMTLIAEAGKPLETPISVDGGREKSVCVYPQRSAYAFAKKGENASILTEVHTEKLRAPIAKDEKIGELIIFRDGIETDRVALLAAESVAKATLWDRMKDIAREWNG